MENNYETLIQDTESTNLELNGLDKSYLTQTQKEFYQTMITANDEIIEIQERINQLLDQMNSDLKDINNKLTNILGEQKEQGN